MNTLNQIIKWMRERNRAFLFACLLILPALLAGNAFGLIKKTAQIKYHNYVSLYKYKPTDSLMVNGSDTLRLMADSASTTYLATTVLGRIKSPTESMFDRIPDSILVLSFVSGDADSVIYTTTIAQAITGVTGDLTTVCQFTDTAFSATAAYKRKTCPLYPDAKLSIYFDVTSSTDTLRVRQVSVGPAWR